MYLISPSLDNLHPLGKRLTNHQFMVLLTFASKKLRSKNAIYYTQDILNLLMQLQVSLLKKFTGK